MSDPLTFVSDWRCCWAGPIEHQQAVQWKGMAVASKEFCVTDFAIYVSRNMIMCLILKLMMRVQIKES